LITLSIRIERLANSEGLPLPSYATQGSAGMDLTAAIPDEITLEPGERALIPTGFRIEIPAGYEGQVRARSGMALKRGIGIPNAPGTIDSDYRGEVGVIIINWDTEPQCILRGDRIAQLVIAPVVRAELIETVALEQTPRGEGGFGHTGF
jgi:dUTP pyrophosphatase